ncbi:EamA family transporter [Actomonas aquatica]|uniref:EamA family transporter n=1 Tax=Actomonas aquatica TaxID=2866162 RepID=A0ABZ1C8W6_9BACT|nr:EamA family transporter [Opitutus sp. WL0086]WRQ87815.1 EamA family transporter [Opitutus sp. WL0086]
MPASSSAPTVSLPLDEAGSAAAASSRRWADTALTALTPMIWGSTYLVTTEWLPPERPFTAACIRTLPAGLALLLWQGHRLPRGAWPRLLLLGILNIGLFQALLFAAAYRLPGGIAAILGATMPLLVLGLTWIFDQRRPPLLALGAGLTAVLGMAAIFAGPATSNLDPVGLLAAAGGTVCLALGTYLTGRTAAGTPAVPLLTSTGWQLTFSGLLLAPAAWWLEAPIAELQVTHIVGYTYLCLAGALLSYPLWFRGIRRLSASAVSALGLLSPLTALVLGWLVLGQAFSPTQLAGMTIVLAAIFTLQWALRPQR